MTLRTFAAVAASAVAALALTVGPATTATAKSSHQVDPATMSPALNPTFAPWSCFTAGTGVICQGERTRIYHEPIGLFCDGQEVWVSGSGHERMTRWHTADGRATRTAVHLDYPGDVFSLSESGAGPTLTIRGHWNRHYVYAVPGDLSSRTLTERGAIYMATSPGSGVVLHDSGSVRFEPGADFDAIAVMHGVHDAYSDSGAVDAVICDALTPPT
jgi:hypothetical protein